MRPRAGSPPRSRSWPAPACTAWPSTSGCARRRPPAQTQHRRSRLRRRRPDNVQAARGTQPRGTARPPSMRLRCSRRPSCAGPALRVRAFGSRGAARGAVGRRRAAPAPLRLERLPATVRRGAARRAAAAGRAELPRVRRQRGRLRADPAPALGAQGAPPCALGRPQSVGRCGALRAERQRTAPSSALARVGLGRLPPQRGWASFLQLRMGC